MPITRLGQGLRGFAVAAPASTNTLKGVMDMSLKHVIAAAVGVFMMSGSASASQIFFNGFETDIGSWDVFTPVFHPTRVGSGTNAITSAQGSHHAEVGSNAATNWGGYSYGQDNNAANIPNVSFQPYSTSLDIYLNVDGNWSNDTRFDYTSAINEESTGGHRRDFVFNIGFYNDGTGPGANSNRFVVSASNNAGRANSFPKNPGRNPISITNTGWYTFEHLFYEDAGILAVDLNILDSLGTPVNSWTLSNAADVIGLVGGNRYGWVANNEFSLLAIDNSSMNLTGTPAEVAEPATLAILGLGLAGLGLAARRRRLA